MDWDSMSHKEQLAASHYDFYKSVYGVRPRWMNYDAMTVADLEKAMDELAIQSEIQAKLEAEAEAVAIQKFESRIQELMGMGATSREQAIQWITQAENAEYAEPDYLCYLLGLPYGYIK